MATVVEGAGKEKSGAAVKSGKRSGPRPQKSVRKHIRMAKAALRRELGPAEAKKAIDQLVQRLRK